MKLLIYIIGAVVLFFLYVRYLEKTTLFVPSKELRVTPRDLGLAYDDVYIQTEDQVTIHGWFLKTRKENGTLVFFHGNAGNIGDRLEKIQMFYQMGLNVLIVDYRGYGKSEGYPTEEGMYKDALAAYDYLLTRQDVDPQKIIGYGASLGGAAVIDMAAQRTLACLIVDSTFTNARDMAKRIFPFIPGFLVSIKLDSIGKIMGIKTPKLFFHSQEDETVPYELGRKLFDAAPEPKKFVDLKGGHDEGHMQSGHIFIGEIRDYLARLDLLLSKEPMRWDSF